ncbi:hypothetical protein ACFQX6_47835 [Streptosporangium lutulentum]
MPLRLRGGHRGLRTLGGRFHVRGRGDAVVKGTHFEDELDGFHAAVAAGMGEELADQGTGTTVAVAVVLRGIGVHLIDSSDRSFRMAGRLAVRDALIRAYGPPPRPKRPRT